MAGFDLTTHVATRPSCQGSNPYTYINRTQKHLSENEALAPVRSQGDQMFRGKNIQK
jgi:hypothetical protein